MMEYQMANEIEHPAWSIPLQIDIEEDGCLYDVGEDDAGKVIITRIPLGSVSQAGDRSSGIKTTDQHPHLVGVVSRQAGLCVRVGQNIDLNPVDQRVEGSVFLIARKPAYLGHHLSRRRDNDEQEIAAREFVGHFSPSRLADPILPHARGVTQ